MPCEWAAKCTRAPVVDTVTRSDLGPRRAGASLGSPSRSPRVDGMLRARVVGAENCGDVLWQGL